MDQSQDKHSLLQHQIEKLINKGFIEEAINILDKYENTFNNDEIWLLTTKSVINLIKGDLDSAEILLKNGLAKYPFNADILFNLAYLYEQKKDFQLAYDYYLDAEYILNEEEKQVARSAIEALEKSAYNLIKKQKIAVFVKPGLDNFIDDIVYGLSDEYRVHKVLVRSYDQIDQGMKWADICWFEWCDELISYASQLDISNSKKIICRLHSYEAFTNYTSQVNWKVVDKVIFVAEHIKQYVLENEKKLSEEQTIVVPNGIDLNKYTYKERQMGFNIAYVGYINYKKGPMLLLHAFKAIFDQDKRYKLYIAGKFQDPRYALYYQQMIKELGLEKNVFIDGWQEDINQWLGDKHYIISTSVLEGHPVGVMEGMARGLKPLIHNYVGAKKQFDKFVWSTLDELVKKVIYEPYNPVEYRRYIEENYSLVLQIENIKKLLLIKQKEYYYGVNIGSK
ncbi:glycosyltransferase [Schinkia sp. CFF1]